MYLRNMYCNVYYNSGNLGSTVLMVRVNQKFLKMFMINIDTFTNSILLKREKIFSFTSSLKSPSVRGKSTTQSLLKSKSYYSNQRVVSTAQTVKNIS